ncbi:MAG: HAD family phosphatase [Candidatus Peribacteraceae bacterium]|nr:HAD family phosphatase [Candidatus Peribacteraceae bacterium]
MKFNAVIFDLDGTLVDTIPLWMQAYRQVFADFGAEVSEEDFITRIYVHSLPLMEALQLEHLPADIEPAFRKKRDERYVSLLQSKARWLPKAQDVLTALRERLPTAVATGSHRIYTDALDRGLRLYSYADTITCDDVKRDKPAPDMLLLAAERLAVAPQQCLYVGDQLFDVEAAKAAGMACWIIPNTSTPDRAIQEADAVLRHLSDILSVA